MIQTDHIIHLHNFRRLIFPARFLLAESRTLGPLGVAVLETWRISSADL